ncbi:MAG: EAL domain-containing protein, partial [Woeseiaceae bacterium]
NQFVADDTLEDYALRYVPSKFRKWSELLIANTALGGISFLALEAIGASIVINYGFSNALWAILVVGLIIFLTNLPIAYYAAKYNLDIDLLTRGAGFGYIGSTITSLIYASFTFIFFALEASIMAQALELYFHLPLVYGYIVCSLIIIPLVFFGVTFINKLEAWTQPLWLILLVMPFAFIYHKAPETFEQFLSFAGQSSSGANFDPLLFGAAATISFSLIVQIGEQVDYLRFMPDKGPHNQKRWWLSMLAAGPGWIILGVAKQLAGAFLAFLAITQGLSLSEAHQPTQMYLTAYGYVFSSPAVVLVVTVLFVVVSQIKINVTNAYAGSLAWSNFFSRLTHSHPGRVVWLVFNITIALLLMELNVFTALGSVLGLYANVAVAWIGALAADLMINKPLGLSPTYIEFRRSHLHHINPVGTGAMLIASVVSIAAFLGVFGAMPQAFSSFISLGLAITLVPIIALLTKSRFYLASRPIDETTHEHSACTVCGQYYAPQDTSFCPRYNDSICSLCCTLDARCEDECKPKKPIHHRLGVWLNKLKESGGTRFLFIFIFLSSIIGAAFAIAYMQHKIASVPPLTAGTLAQLEQSFLSIYFIILILLGMMVWWIVLTERSYHLTQNDLDAQNAQLQDEIIDHRAVEEQLAEKEERLSLAARHNGVGIWDLDPQTEKLIWDDSMFSLFHIQKESFSGAYDAWVSTLHPDDREYAERDLHAALSGEKTFDTDFRIIWPNGEVRNIKGIAKVFRDKAGNPIRMLGINADITEQRQAEDKLRLMAHYDLLTGLPNRALFIDRLHKAIAHSHRSKHQLAICYLDLDHFKPVNDNYGHDVGDQLLIEVAQRISSTIREEDTVSRQGGDEFVLLLNDITSFEQYKQTLERIQYAIAQPFIIDNHSHIISVSSGVTLYPSDNSDIGTLLRHADQAMYQSKQSGRGHYYLFNTKQEQAITIKYHQLDEIEQALANNEFQLYYQPKVNMESGKVFGAEALIRWIHPKNGLIPPLDFLPIIEGTELEIKVGNWVISQALQQLDAWQKQDIYLEVSVNIASHHLLSESFFTELDTVLSKHPSVDSKYLQLEILESSALGDLNAISTIIETCQSALGIKVALDDFGTGYSSLTHLRSLPVDTIKIDQSFVRDMLDDPNDFTIIDGVIGLSDSFNREIIAEGVETTEHGLMLLIMGCKNVQGYGIAKPMPASNFPQWLKNYTPNQEWLQCSNQQRTKKENKVKLFILITEHWKDIFINNIQSSPEELEHWPIMNSKHCPCGMWIKRAKQDQLFEEKGLNQLDQTYIALHAIAQAMHSQYLNGNVNNARKKLSKFQTAFDEMNQAVRSLER